jgi:hypothetical protein
MPNSRTHLVAVIGVLASMVSGAAVAGESPSWPQRAGHAVERAGEAAGHGLKRGVEATSHGVQVGVKATGQGLSRAGEAVEHAAHKTAEKVRSTFQK